MAWHPCPETELDKRLDVAKRSQDLIREADCVEDRGVESFRSFRLNLMQFFLFLCLDYAKIEQLENWLDMGDIVDAEMNDRIITIESLLAHFLQRDPIPGQSQPDVPSQAQTSGTAAGGDDRNSGDAYQTRAGPDEPREPLCRDQVERLRALERDGSRCAITNSIAPDACHIWPLAANNTQERRDILIESLQSCRYVLGDNLMAELLDTLVPFKSDEPPFTDVGDPVASDMAFNMISLDPQYYQYWGQACFGLKWIGLDPNGSKEASDKVEPAEKETQYTVFYAQLHWFPDRVSDCLQRYLLKSDDCDARRRLDLDSEDAIQSIKESLREALYESGSAYSTKGSLAEDRAMIEPGRILGLKVETKDLSKTKALIEAQWLVVQIAALSGAGKVADELKRELPWEYIFLEDFDRLFGPGARIRV